MVPLDCARCSDYKTSLVSLVGPLDAKFGIRGCICSMTVLPLESTLSSANYWAGHKSSLYRAAVARTVLVLFIWTTGSWQASRRRVFHFAPCYLILNPCSNCDFNGRFGVWLCGVVGEAYPPSFRIDWKKMLVWCCLWFHQVRCVALISNLLSNLSCLVSDYFGKDWQWCGCVIPVLLPCRWRRQVIFHCMAVLDWQ